MQRSRILTALLLAAFLVAPASAQSIVRSFDVESGGTLALKLEAGGNVTITGGSSQVEVEIQREGRDAEDVEISFDDGSDHVIVRSEYASRGRHRANVTYTISVPSSFNIDVQLTGGDVRISGVNGRFEGQTMGGDIHLRDLSGEVDLQTMGGEISVRQSQLEGKVHTMGGEINMEDVEGTVESTTMGGDVTFRNVRPGARSEMKVRTMGGSIEVNDAPAGADVQTMGGDITVGEVLEFLKAETMGGDIEVDGVDGWIEAKTMGGNVQIRMFGGTSGDRHVEITSMGGDVDLVVPRGLSMDFDIEIEVEGRGKDASDYVIESDFTMDVSVAGGRGSRDRSTIMASGSVSGGNNRIRIRTINGDVRILADR
jgi:DUF4097 and DUF4098 domain-containing protein YvlB